MELEMEWRWDGLSGKRKPRVPRAGRYEGTPTSLFPVAGTAAGAGAITIRLEAFRKRKQSSVQLKIEYSTIK